jgi:hypothetical protein
MFLKWYVWHLHFASRGSSTMVKKDSPFPKRCRDKCHYEIHIQDWTGLHKLPQYKVKNCKILELFVELGNPINTSWKHFSWLKIACNCKLWTLLISRKSNLLRTHFNYYFAYGICAINCTMIEGRLQKNFTPTMWLKPNLFVVTIRSNF